MIQEVLSYVIVALAVLFLIKRFLFKAKKNKNCDKGCGCG
ncbi:MAG TPA: FeoB-associated Cys-rich membrane protein [Tenacibaculum sp.]|nr:FeoB-associated Cys-rich membrane protein [Tenacibaculum sp.]HBI41039.1 FeoB-associated Cys-rich membrane protein [Tenacibaculum sp.]